MSYEYDQYIKEHVDNVRKGLEWMRDNLLEMVINRDKMTEALLNVEHHDESKYSKEEYDAYDAYFYGGNRSYKTVQNFNLAWLHHQHNNPHHWQYWVLVNDDPSDGTVALEMPLEYVYEMIADWWSFSWRDGNLMEIFDWFADHKNRMVMHRKTWAAVHRVMESIAAVLYAQDVIQHEDGDDEDKKYGVPEQKKFPLPDADHVKSAIRFFNYVEAKYEKELAEAILERAEEYDVKIGTDISIGDDNRFKKYLPKEDES